MRHIDNRIRICRLVEKIDNNVEFSKQYGITNVSSFHGELIANICQKGKINGKKNKK